eukprot:23433-Eustigmatos_ZCMA.PRE.1
MEGKRSHYVFANAAVTGLIYQSRPCAGDPAKVVSQGRCILTSQRHVSVEGRELPSPDAHRPGLSES